MGVGRGVVVEMVRGGCEMYEGAGRKREEESMGFVVREENGLRTGCMAWDASV